MQKKSTTTDLCERRGIVEHALRGIIIAATGGILALPFFLDAAVYETFIFPRVLAFQILVDVSVLAWSVLALRNASYRPNLFHPIVAGFVLYAIALLIHLPLSVNPAQSFFSTPDRMMGMMSLFHFWMWSILLASCFRTRREWGFLLCGALIIAAVAVLYGLLQFLQLPFVFTTREFGSRIVGTIGNPLFFGAYMLVAASIGAVLAAQAKQLLLRLLLAFTFGLFGVGMLLTGSRALVVTSVVAVLGYGAVFASQARNKMLSIVMAGSVVFLFFAGLFLYGAASRPQDARSPFSVVLRPFTSLIDPQRITAARVGMDGFFSRPFFGWGMENFDSVFYTFIPSALYGERYTGQKNSDGAFMKVAERFAIEKKRYDHAHNQFVETLATTGIIGFLGLSAAWIAVLYSLSVLWRRSSDLSDRMSIAAVGIGIAAYHMQNGALFDTPLAYSFLMLLVAFVLAMSRDMRIRLPSVSVPCMSYVLVALAFSIASIISIAASVAAYRASRIISDAEKILVYNPAQGAGRFQYAIQRFSPYAQYDRMRFAAAVLRAIPATQDQQLKLFLLSGAINETEQANRSIPRDMRLLLALTELYREAALLEPGYNQRAYRLVQAALGYYPTSYDLLMRGIDFALANQDYARAETYVDRIAYNDPGRSEALMLRARVYRDAGRYDEMFEMLERARAVYPLYQDSSFYVPLGFVLPASHVDKALFFTTRGVKAYPRDLGYQRTHLRLFRIGGKIQEEKNYLYWLQQKYPDVFGVLEKEFDPLPL
ncbi:O-antigen ligase family protein [Candidatus Uhrbacteria bacterium]|nr:O-antigen ligase family protein [Candidatus Uhrbacteria bacterium]